jgi:SSS family solute:Na+ symporter
MKLAGPLYLVLPGIIAWHIAFGTDQSPPAGADAAYGYLVNLVLPKWAVGFFAATIFGAILSSFNSFLNSGCTLFSIDLYKGVLNTEAPDRQVVKAGKMFGMVMVPVSVVLALLLSPFAETGLFNLMKSIAAVLNIPLLAIVFMGIVSKKTPAVAANYALLAGIIFQSVFGIAMGNTLFGSEMHWLHLAAVNFLFLVALMTTVRLISPRPEPFVQEYSKDVDITPWPMAKPLGLTIVVLITAMYLGMWAKFGITPGSKLATEYEQLHPTAAD